MSRNDKARKRARKERKRSELNARAKAEEEQRLHPPSPTSVNHSRLRQIFSTMSFRSHIKGGTKPFADHVLGPTVEASTPEDLAEKTAEFYVEQALKQTPS